MNDNRNKVHLHLNIRKDYRAFLKEQKINASMFFENAVAMLKNGLNADSTFKSMGIILMYTPDETEIRTIIPERRQREPEHPQASPPKEETRNEDITIDTVKDGDNLSWNGGYSMAVFLKSWESKYIRYKRNTGVEEKTIRDYLNLISKLTWVYNLEDIKDRDYIKKSDKDAVYEVCAFLRDELIESKDTFNGYSNSQYRKIVAERYKPNRGKHSKQKTRELINFPEIIIQTMDLLPADIQVFFIITAVCGARTTQLFRVFENPLKILKHDRFFRIVAEDAGQGSKLATEYFLPMEYLPMVENFRLYDTKTREDPSSFYNDEVNKVSRIINPAIPCNLSSLRKFCKAVFSKSKIPKASAEYTQGRKPQDVGDKDYDNLAIAAVDDYPGVLPFWEKYVHLPDWMKDGNEVKVRVDEAIKARYPYDPNKKKWNDAAIIKRLKNGATNAELKKEYGVGTQKITNLVKRKGIIRTRGRKASKIGET